MLYIASMQNEKRFVQLEEISSKLSLPKQFIGRILKTLAKEKALKSFKGPTGGFTINEEGLHLPLLKLLEITDGNRLDNCVLKKKNCNPVHPCPVHDRFSAIRAELILVMTNTTIAQLVIGSRKDLIKTLSELNAKGQKKL